MSKNAVLLLLFFIVGAAVIGPFIARGFALGDGEKPVFDASKEGTQKATVLSGGFLLAQNGPYFGPEQRQGSPKAIEHLKSSKIGLVLVTAYSSSPDETDETPFITASGNLVDYGVVAANFLPLGARIRLPKLFGSQVFVVEDRLHERYNDRVDVWLPSKADAIQFGQKVSEIEIL